MAETRAGTACSIVGAALWVANIGALFPIIQTTLNGHSLQDWNNKRATEAAKETKVLDAQIATSEQKFKATSDPDQKKKLGFQLDVLRGKKQAEQLTLASSLRLQPYLEYLPSKPFPTVLLIVAAVVLATILKQIVSLTDTMLVSSVSQSIARDMRLRIFDKALSLDRRGFNALGISGFSAYIMQTTDMLASGITSFYDGAFNEPLRVIGCLIGAMLISWRLTLASLIFTPLVVMMIVWLNRRIRDISRRVVNRSRRIQPRDDRGLQLANDGSGIHNGGLRARAVWAGDQGHATGRASIRLLQLARQSDHRNLRDGHALHCAGRRRISPHQSRNEHLRNHDHVPAALSRCRHSLFRPDDRRR